MAQTGPTAWPDEAQFEGVALHPKAPNSAVGMGMSIQRQAAGNIVYLRIGAALAVEKGWTPGDQLNLAWAAPDGDLVLRIGPAGEDGALRAARAHGKRSDALMVRLHWLGAGLPPALMRNVEWSHAGDAVLVRPPAEWREAMIRNLEIRAAGTRA